MEKRKNIKMNKFIRYILIALIVLNCILIFNFSSEKSEKSDVTSGRVINTIIEINPRTKGLSNQEKEKVKKRIVVPVRKTAHFTVYTSLGMLLYLCARTFEGENKRKMLISLMLAFLYACSDEIHQLFVSGRSCELKDVCIDTCGALFGIVIALGIVRILTIIKEKKKM